MSPKQVVGYFKSQGRAAKALGISQPSIALWVASGEVPPTRQTQIEKVTNGALKPSRKALKWLRERGYRT